MCLNRCVKFDELNMTCEECGYNCTYGIRCIVCTIGEEVCKLKKENEQLQKLNEELTSKCDYYHELNEHLQLENQREQTNTDSALKEIIKLKQEIKQLVAIGMTPECAAIKLKDLSIE